MNHDLCSTVRSLAIDVQHKLQLHNTVTALPHCDSSSFGLQLNCILYCLIAVSPLWKCGESNVMPISGSSDNLSNKTFILKKPTYMVLYMILEPNFKARLSQGYFQNIILMMRILNTIKVSINFWLSSLERRKAIQFQKVILRIKFYPPFWSEKTFILKFFRYQVKYFHQIETKLSRNFKNLIVDKALNNNRV